MSLASLGKAFATCLNGSFFQMVCSALCLAQISLVSRTPPTNTEKQLLVWNLEGTLACKGKLEDLVAYGKGHPLWDHTWEDKAARPELINVSVCAVSSSVSAQHLLPLYPCVLCTISPFLLLWSTTVHLLHITMSDPGPRFHTTSYSGSSTPSKQAYDGALYTPTRAYVYPPVSPSNESPLPFFRSINVNGYHTHEVIGQHQTTSPEQYFQYDPQNPFHYQNQQWNPQPQQQQ